MKRFFIMLTIFAFMLPLCSEPIKALTGPITGDNTENDPIVINAIFDEAVKDIIILEEKGDLSIDDFPLGNIYPFIDTKGRGQILEIQWNMNDPKLSEPGYHWITGTPILGKNMIFAEGFDPIIRWPLFRKGGEKLELSYVSLPATDSPIMEQCKNPEDELNFRTVIHYVMTETNYQLSTMKDDEFYMEWDLSLIDPDTLGSYDVVGTLHYPDWVTVPEEYQSRTITVFVMPADRIEIYGAVRYSSNGDISINWTYNSLHVTEAVLERKIDNDQWTTCDSSWYRYEHPLSSSNSFLTLCAAKIPREEPVVLRLRYVDNGKERITEPITIVVPLDLEKQLAEKEFHQVLDILEGDRDGGDNNGDDLPNYEQNTPPTNEPSQGNNTNDKTDTSNTNNNTNTVQKNTNSTQKNTTTNKNTSSAKTNQNSTKANDSDKNNQTKEVITETYTAISGQRLNDLIKQNDTVLFEKQGIALEIPSSLLKNLKLSDNELLEVTITSPQKNTVTVEVKANGKEVSDLSGSLIRIPWSENAEPSVRNTADSSIVPAEYNKQNSIVEFTISSPGTYVLTGNTEENTAVTTSSTPYQEPIEEKRSKLPVILMIIAALAAIAATTVIILRRKRHE